jgi:hypothetical protein
MKGEIENKAGEVTGFDARNRTMEVHLTGWLAVGDRIRVREKGRSEDPQELRLKFEMTVAEIRHQGEPVQQAFPKWTVQVGRVPKLAEPDTPKEGDLVFRVVNVKVRPKPPVEPPPPIEPPKLPPPVEPSPSSPKPRKPPDGEDWELPDLDDFPDDDDEDDDEDDGGSKGGRIGG